VHPETKRVKMAAGTPLEDEDRWPWLRRIADWIGARETAGQGAVITCSALKRRYRELLREGHPSVRFVHLAADPALITERITGRTGHYQPPVVAAQPARRARAAG
jgi:gluconokinase